MRYSTTAFAAGLAVAAAIALGAQPAAANHPVLVEGNNATDAGPRGHGRAPGGGGRL